MLLDIVTIINNFLWDYIVLWFLLLAGIFFTFYLRFIPLRFTKNALGVLLRSKQKSHQQISSFQALCTSLAQRVGTGNLAGVAIALNYGGKGAIFWMWATALLGASTAFAECTLAQVFKLKKADGSFYGGPAYYIHAGLRSKPLAYAFSFSLIIAMGFVFNSVQSNTIAHGVHNALSLPPWACGIGLAALSSLVIFGGRQRIVRVAEVLVPIMSLSYLALTFFVMIKHWQDLPLLISQIMGAAFTTKAAIGGIFGHTIKEAFRHGVARGLFSNEAGWGSAPNAAASASVDHPVQQGLVQMLAVYIDTLLICTCTAVLILLATVDHELTGIHLTQAAAVFHFGEAGRIFVAVAILLFGFTTILGNTFYGEANVRFIFKHKNTVPIFRLLVLAMVIIGSVLEVPTVWKMADLMSAVMLLINLTSIILLASIVKKAANHYQFKFLPHKAGFSFGDIGLLHFTNYRFAYEKKPEK